MFLPFVFIFLLPLAAYERNMAAANMTFVARQGSVVVATTSI